MDNLPIIPTVTNIDVYNAQTLEEATLYLSELNKSLDAITAHKEAKTKPINEALKKIRQDYKPLETQLEQAIAQIRQSITTYATQQAKIAQEQEQKILNDKRTTLDTKISKLATIEPTNEKVSTEQGSITFTTVKKYAVSDKITNDQLANLYRNNILELNTTTLKAYIKTSSTTPEGITVTEEQSLRNYR